MNLKAFVDELEKIAEGGLVQRATSLAWKHKVPLALLGGGALAYRTGAKELEKYRLGRQVYDQMQTQGQ